LIVRRAVYDCAPLHLVRSRSKGGGLLDLGYRIYFMTKGTLVIVLLAGGDKSTQAADIAKAKAIAQEWE